MNYNYKKVCTAVVALTIAMSAMITASSCAAGSSEPVSVTYETKVETAETTIVTTEEPEPPLVLLPEAEERLGTYEHYAGWISIPGIVDEPVVQYTDNAYYLDKNSATQQYDVGGAIYADFRCVLDTRKRSENIVLYGHNQKDGTRFGQLDFYKWNPLTYYKKQPVISYNTAYDEREYKIFAMFIINTKEEHDTRPLFDYHNYIELDDDARFNEFVEQCRKRSLVITDVDIQRDDHFLTLSTCSTEFDESRFVIVAREVREGESSEVDVSTAKTNTNPLYPAIFYKYNGGSYIE